MEIVKPSTPYQGPIQGGIHEGKRIQIKGYVPYGADRFTVNLMAGRGDSCDRPLHISVRFNGNVAVRNTYQNNAWCTEERHGAFPFAAGSNFTMMILVARNAYKISVNGQHYWDFCHRLPFTRANSIFINGDVQINMIKFINKNPNPPVNPAVVIGSSSISSTSNPPVNPAVVIGGSSISSTSPTHCTFPIYGGIRPGMYIYISGRPTAAPHKFTINLQSGISSSYPPPDIAFHFDVRFFNYTVVRNSRVNTIWSAEETMISHFPFQPGCSFDMIIRVQSDMFVVILKGQQFLSFRHRLNAFPRFNVLSCENDIIVTSIRYT